MLATANKIDKKPLVYFIGLSVKPMCEHLDPETRTGNIIDHIVGQLPTVTVIKTNLVKTAPLDQDGNLRYPNADEMRLGWYDLKDEISRTKPDLLVTLGQQVSLFLRSQMGIQPAKPQFPPDFSYESYLSQSQAKILSIHHPSFIYVYHRKEIDIYIENVIISISALLPERYCSGRSR
jgi:uracil-DNA glycosylase